MEHADWSKMLELEEFALINSTIVLHVGAPWVTLTPFLRRFG